MKNTCTSCLKEFVPIKFNGNGMYSKWCSSCREILKEIRGGRDISREKVRIRKNHTCEDCALVWQRGNRRFDIHHGKGECGEKSRKYDRETDRESLRVLCHNCHFHAHDHTFNTKDSSRKRLTPAQRMELVQLYKTGKYTYAEVGMLFDVKYATAYKLVKNHG